jgi:Lar family restriction alleviation protein
MAELKPCPFCGGEAKIHYQPIYMDNGVCIVCTECNARSKFLPCDCTYQYYHGEENVFISKEQATRDVTTLWNTRTPQKLNHNSLCETETYRVGE